MRTYKRDGYTLVQCAHPEGGRVAYRVFVDEVEVGMVGTYQANMERRGKGLRYVYARWCSERWWCREAGRLRTFYHAWESAAAAARSLLR